MMQVTANTITFRGSAFNMSAVANFIDNLDRVEAFTEPILRDATRAGGGGGRGATSAADLYNFQLAVNYSFKREPPPAPEGGEAATTSATGGAVATAVAAKSRREGALE